MAMSGPAWLEQYAEGDAAGLRPAHATVLAMWDAAVASRPDGTFLVYFGARMTFAESDALAEALAAGWADAGVGAGQVVAVFLQNVPAFAITAVAAWKLGCIVVPVNPMSKVRELAYILADCSPTVLVAHPGLHDDVVAPTLAADGDRDLQVFVSPEDDFAPAGIPAVFAVSATSDQTVTGLMAVIEQWQGAVAPPLPPQSYGSPAMLTYTSGTTGDPKGAVNTHGNVAFNAESCWRWIGLDGSDSILAVAPLFHITGFVIHLAAAIFGAVPLVLTYRFDPKVMLEVIEDTRPTFAIGSITAFISLLAASRSDPLGSARLAPLKTVCSGGAPVPPAVVSEYQRDVGPYIRNMYGLTESTSAVTGVPRGRTAPVDPVSGALSIGVPMYATAVRIADDDGFSLPPNQIGELVVSGPQVVPGYWNKPEETAHAMSLGELRTGDVAFMDEEGWIYLVDRKKDMIISSGYKVWPREVEDVLYGHPDVLEAAVVGLPDHYRGESVGAFVVLRPGSQMDPNSLVAYCRQQMAAYKVPRHVRIMEELPKTTTGKILRRVLRAAASDGP